MFKKLLNVGKGNANDKLLKQHQAQQKSIFQLNEISSYGFSHLTCLGYSSSLSLLAVGSKYGLLRILGNASVEFAYQLPQLQAIKQIEFIDCRENTPADNSNLMPKQGKKQNNKKKQQADQKQQTSTQQLSIQDICNQVSTSAKIITLTEDGQLHLLELQNVAQDDIADGATQTESNGTNLSQNEDEASKPRIEHSRYTTLEYISVLDYFKYKLDDDDRSRRITTYEVSVDGQNLFVGTEGGNIHVVPLEKFELVEQLSSNIAVNNLPEECCITNPADNGSINGQKQSSPQKSSKDDNSDNLNLDDDFGEASKMSIADDLQISNEDSQVEKFDLIKLDEHIVPALADEIKSKKHGSVESIKKQPGSANILLISYHRGLSVIFDVLKKQVNKYFYHNQLLESSCFALDSNNDHFYTSFNDGSYIKWNASQQNQIKVNEDHIGQLFGPYPCKPATKIQACKGLLNDQLEDLVIFSGGMPRATYDDKNPVTIVRAKSGGKDVIKTVLDFSSKVLDFVVITKPRGNVVSKGDNQSGGKHGGKKNKNKHKEQHQQNRNQQVAYALAVLAEEEFVVIDLLNSEQFLEFPLPYLNCVHSSAITCNQHYSDIDEDLYKKLLALNKQLYSGKLSQNEWPITGGQIVEGSSNKSHDILLTGHEDGSVNFWDVSDLSMKHLVLLSTQNFFASSDDDFLAAEDEINGKKDILTDNNNIEEESNKQLNNSNDNNKLDDAETWHMKKVGKFDPYSDDSRLAVKKLGFSAEKGTLVVAGTGGQILAFELSSEQSQIDALSVDEQVIVDDHRFVWKGRDKLNLKRGSFNFSQGYKLSSIVQLSPPVAATALDLCSDWNVYAVGTSYGFLMYDYNAKVAIINKCTLNVHDFAIVSGDANSALSRKKSFRKSLRESFRRLRRGRSQKGNSLDVSTGTRAPDAINGAPTRTFGRTLTGVRNFGTTAPALAGGVAVFATERQVEQKVELSSIIKCLNLTSAIVTGNGQFSPTLWVGTNAGLVLLYQLSLNESTSAPSRLANQDNQNNELSITSNPNDLSQKTTARLLREIHLKHKAPIIAIFTTPDAKTVNPKQLKESNVENSPDDKAIETEVNTDNQGVPQSNQSSPAKSIATSVKVDSLQVSQTPRVLICSEEQFKVFSLPSFKAFCKFKLTAHEGLRARKINITHFTKPLSNKSTQMNGTTNKSELCLKNSSSKNCIELSEKGCALDQQTDNGLTELEKNNNTTSTVNNNHSLPTSKELMNAKFGAKAKPVAVSDKTSSPSAVTSVQESQNNSAEPFMVCMSNQGDCAVYSIPDLKRQAQIQVCQREDVSGITSAMLTNNGEGFYLKSSTDFLRFSITTQRVLRVLSIV